MVLLVSHVSGDRRTWCVREDVSTAQDLLHALRLREGDVYDVVLQSEGRVLCPSSPIDGDAVVVATLRLPGGKGGFGSMLRAIGAQIEKTTNREACRDLSGRRLRDINEEKRLKDFIAKKADRERELQEKKRQKFKSLQETPKHTFQDESYFQQRELREKNLYDSLDKAFDDKSSGSSGTKRSMKEEPTTKQKKGRFMNDLDDSSSEEESDSEGAVARLDESSDSGSNSNTQHQDQPATSCSVSDSDSSDTKTNIKEKSLDQVKNGESKQPEEDEAKSQDTNNSEHSTSNSNDKPVESDNKKEGD